jgi:hypothetical protein
MPNWFLPNTVSHTTQIMTSEAITVEPLQHSGPVPRWASNPATVFFVAVTLGYLAFSPGTLEGLGYNGENLSAVNQFVANAANLFRQRPLAPVSWTRHGGLELLFELPFALISHLFFGSSVKWLGRVMSLQTILATAALCTLLFVWASELTKNARWSYGLALAAAFATMLWPYAYIGLETTQSLCLCLAGYLALSGRARYTWLELFAFAFFSAAAITVKLNGGFLVPAILFLSWVYLGGLPAKQAKRGAALIAVIVLFLFSLNYYLKAIYWAKTGGGSTGYFLDMLVSSPTTALLQAFSFFGSANKSLLIYAPLVFLALWRLPQAWRVNQSLVSFALLVLGGLIGGFALVVVWTDETWGPRYLHSAIVPLLMCLAAAKSGLKHTPRRDAPLLVLAMLGILVSLPGVLVAYTRLHQAAIASSQSTLSTLQYDPTWNHIRFNYKLLGLWLEAIRGASPAPARWPPAPRWWFEQPTDAAPLKTVDLRELAIPQPLVLQEWRPSFFVPNKVFQVIRGGTLACLVLSLGLLCYLCRMLRANKI